MSKFNKNRNGLLVFPGEKLGVIEEFMPGNGVYVENGNLHSFIVGQIIVNDRRELNISRRTRQPLIPREGDIVIGEVVNAREKNLTMKVLQIGNQQLSTSFIGIMHISDASNRRIRTMNGVFKGGDFVRARVISTKNGEIHLSTKNDNFGVIHAYCVYCGKPLLRDKGRLRCAGCNKIDKRKMTVDYGA